MPHQYAMLVTYDHIFISYDSHSDKLLSYSTPIIMFVCRTHNTQHTTEQNRTERNNELYFTHMEVMFFVKKT